MQQPQVFFPEDNVSKQKAAFNQRQKHLCSFYASPDKGEEMPVEIVVNRTNSGSVKYFDLVTQNSFFRADASAEAAPTKEVFFTETNKNRISFFITALEISPSAKSFPVAACASEKLVELLLFYFDQIIYLKEMSEKIRELGTAIRDENVAQINTLARDCAALSNSCGMTTAIAPLRHLAHLKTKLQMTDAAFLLRQVRKEFRCFRLALKESLEQLVKQTQLDKLALAS